MTAHTEDDLHALLAEWSEERSRYPGWIVCPESSRRFLWDDTARKLNTLYNYIASNSQKAPIEALRALYELNWRLELCLFPLFLYPHLHALYATVTESLESSGLHLLSPADKTLYDALLVARVRAAREDFDFGTFGELQQKARDSRITEIRLEHELLYQTVLATLEQLDINAARKVLDTWIPPQQLFQYRIKRAALLGHVGQAKEGISLLEDVLLDIRAAEQVSPQDIRLASLEAWTIFVLRFVGMSAPLHDPSAQSFYDKPYASDLMDRENQLKTLNCDPWDEVNFFSAKMTEQYYIQEKANSRRKVTFDGVVRIKTHFASHRPPRTALGYSLIRLFEEAGAPLNVGHSYVATEAQAVAANLIGIHSPRRAISLLIRTNSKDLDWISRLRLLRMPKEDVDYLHHLLSTALYNLTSSLRSLVAGEYPAADSEIFYRTLNGVADAWSRLGQVLDMKQLDDMLAFIISFYFSDADATDPRLADAMESLYERCLPLCKRHHLVKYFDKLFPLSPRNPNHPLYKQDPVLMLPLHLLQDEAATNTFLENAFRSQAVNLYLQWLKDPDRALRLRALLRLYKIYTAGLLTGKEEAEFASVLWDNTEEGGIPHLPSTVRKYVVLALPHPPAIKPQSRLRSYFLSFFPRLITNPKRFPDPVVQRLVDMHLSSRRVSDQRPELIEWGNNDLIDILDWFSAWIVPASDEVQEMSMITGDQHELFERAGRMILELLIYVQPFPEMAEKLQRLSEAWNKAKVPTEHLDAALYICRNDSSQLLARLLSKRFETSLEERGRSIQAAVSGASVLSIIGEQFDSALLIDAINEVERLDYFESAQCIRVIYNLRAFLIEGHPEICSQLDKLLANLWHSTQNYLSSFEESALTDREQQDEEVASLMVNCCHLAVAGMRSCEELFSSPSSGFRKWAQFSSDSSLWDMQAEKAD